MNKLPKFNDRVKRHWESPEKAFPQQIILLESKSLRHALTNKFDLSFAVDEEYNPWEKRKRVEGVRFTQ